MIVIVGAGLIGLSIAYELAKRGAGVRVVDAREPGKAASWAGAGMLAPYTENLESSAFETFCTASLAAYPPYVRELHECGGVDARLRLDGIVEAAFDYDGAARLHAHVAALEARGIPARRLTREEVRALEPGLGSAVVAGAFKTGEGAVDNRRLGRALHAACLARGVRIDERAGEAALEADTRRALGVRIARGFVPAETVVNATGAWAGALEGVPAHARVNVIPVKGQMLALAMPRGFVQHVTWVPGAYVVPRDDGRLLIGATVEDVEFDVRVTARGTSTLLAAALAALPALADLTVAESWAGIRPGTPDGLPYLGETTLSGYVVAGGHYRNGILLAPATATAVADILEGRSRPDLAPFSPKREEARPPWCEEAGATVAKETV